MDSNNLRKIALVTGATGAIGEAIVRNIAIHHEYAVHFIARDEDKAGSLKERIVNATRNTSIEYHILNLSDRRAIYQLAESWSLPLHVLVNNAATAPRSRLETSDGIELQFATNVLGYFRMISAFTKDLKTSAPSRVVNVASYWAGGLVPDDLEFKKRTYDNDAAYRQSKQANRMLTAAFAEKLKASNVKVVSCHPGDVNSTLSNDLGFGGHESPDQGARTPVWLATRAHEELQSGAYYAHMHLADCHFCQNKDAVHKLYDICESYG